MPNVSPVVSFISANALILLLYKVKVGLLHNVAVDCVRMQN